MGEDYFEFIALEDGQKPVYSNDPLYDLFIGGNIDPRDMLKNANQVVDIERALDLAERFLREAEESGHLVID